MNLEKKYNRDDFLSFLNSFVPKFSKDIRRVATNGLQVAKEVFYLGESSELNLSVFELTHSSSADARVALAMDGFRVMRNSAIYRALVIYRADKGEDWRLSLMTATPEVNQKGKVSQVFSNPRRFSFFLGPSAKVNTPYQFLIKQGAVKDFAELQKRFSLEVVNKEFYKQISENFIKLVGGTLGSGKNKKIYKAILKIPSAPDQSQVSLEFAVRLMGRVIFCWFLREKKSSADVSLMPKELLSLGAIAKYSDYYHQILESIFFEVLNKEPRSREDAYLNESFSLIPYLNGGLFSPHEDDYYKRRNGEQSLYHNTLIIPDEWFVDFFRTLETYNFTIDENTSFDEELSIDPEMLGRIFENLLAEINPETGESARKSTGSYYTPRAIVDYMVDESLFLYLKQQTSIEENKLRAVISYDLSDDSEYTFNESEKRKVIDAIEKLKLLDPACGSGAFPIGALQKIVFILQQIDQDGQLWFKTQIKKASPEIRRVIEREFSHKNFDYIRKLGVIRENIYGIDIQPIATEISRLRCFLTLVVDERVDDSLTNRGIEPLPNLDFKFVTANSLIGLPNNQQATLFRDQVGIDQLKGLRNQFFNATNSERHQLKDEFKEIQKRMLLQIIKRRSGDDITQKLSAWDPFNNKASSWFDPEWMFGIENGFSIVIANPPYVEVEKEKCWVDNYFEVLKGHYDLYIFFYKKGVDLLSKDGVICYITPHTFLSYSQFENLRKFIIKNLKIVECTSKVSSIFESAVVDNSIFIGKKSEKNIKSRFSKKIMENGLKNVETMEIDSGLIGPDSFEYELLKAKQDLNIIKAETIPLGEITESSQGITIYAKVQGEKVNYLSKKIKNENSKKVTRGKEISKYKLDWAGDYIEYGDWLWCPRNGKFFENPKIFLRQTSDKIVATIIDDPFYCIDSVHSIIQKDQKYSLSFILGVLNSTMINYVYRKLTAESGKVFAQVKLTKLRTLPIPVITPENKSIIDEIENLVNQILNSKGDENNDYKAQINQWVYKLYGLTSEEMKIVEQSY